MDYPKVICHMYTTIDGKIVTDLAGYPDCLEAGDIYDVFTFKSSNAWGCGRETFQYLSSDEVDLSKYELKKGELTDHFEKDDIYCFAFDRKGKLFFKDAYNDYADRKSRFVMVLTSSVDRRFISYLDSKGILYLICGEKELDLPLFLTKIKKLGITTFMLCGGPQLNALFIQQDLVDEISLVICPGIQGGRKELTFVGTEDVSKFPKFFKVKDARVLKGDTIQLLYTKSKKGQEK